VVGDSGAHQRVGPVVGALLGLGDATGGLEEPPSHTVVLRIDDGGKTGKTDKHGQESAEQT